MDRDRILRERAAIGSSTLSTSHAAADSSHPSEAGELIWVGVNTTVSWRRGWDSNPRTPVKMLLEFQSSAFDRSATSPFNALREDPQVEDRGATAQILATEHRPCASTSASSRSAAAARARVSQVPEPPVRPARVSQASQASQVTGPRVPARPGSSRCSSSSRQAEDSCAKGSTSASASADAMANSA